MPKTAAEIAGEHFDEKLLEGFGSVMAVNEIVSHCELLAACGDVVTVDGLRYAAVGTSEYEQYIGALEPDA